MKIILITLFLICSNVIASESILDFHAKIQILDSGDIIVTESIKVNAENRRIRHGIYRNTPTVYFGIFFTQRNSNITIINTKLDGNDVAYHTQRLLNGIRVYLGSKNSYVSRGIHTYQIVYKADRQVVNFDNSNGIYWNVTGNDWDFIIEHASVDVYLPNSAKMNILKQNAWTGIINSKQQNYTSEVFDDHIHFETTKPLFQQQGFTIQASWPTGLITNQGSKIRAFVKDNVFWFLSVLLLLLFPLYFYSTWKKVGIDPPKKPIFARFEPPHNISPAAIRFITRNYYDGKGFSSAIMNLAVKKFISIEQHSKKKYTFKKLHHDNLDELSKGENRIYKRLFADNKTFTITETYNSKVQSANNLLEDTLTIEYQNLCYMDNNRYWTIGVFLSMLALFFNWGHFFNFSNYAVSSLVMPLVAILLSAFGLAKAHKPIIKLMAVVIPAILTLFGIANQSDKIFVAYIIVIFAILIINALFYYLIQAPTVFGQKTLDKIAGFRMYLATAEQDRLELMHPPEMTPELFEKYLPYALALGVENSWSEQFNNAMKIQGNAIQNYHPNWYVGNNYSSFDVASTASSIGSGLASSVVSASTPPTSSGSSGGFGGGFSGGGGGGGGGGGW